MQTTNEWVTDARVTRFPLRQWARSMVQAGGHHLKAMSSFAHIKKNSASCHVRYRTKCAKAGPHHPMLTDACLSLPKHFFKTIATSSFGRGLTLRSTQDPLEGPALWSTPWGFPLSSASSNWATRPMWGKVFALPEMRTCLVALLSMNATHGRFLRYLRHSTRQISRANNLASRISSSWNSKQMDIAETWLPWGSTSIPPNPHGQDKSSGQKHASLNKKYGVLQRAVISRGLELTKESRNMLKQVIPWSLKRSPEDP